ncbi:MAG: peptidoglycan DD-metalloendopeptidase family protein [Trueperaceae bacterium]
MRPSDKLAWTRGQGWAGTRRRTLLRATLPWALVTVLLAPAFPVVLAQPQPDESRRIELEAQIADYERLLEARRVEAERIEEELGETRARLRRRIAERDEVSTELGELRSRREALQVEIRDLEVRLGETEERIADILADIEALKVRIEALLVNLHRQRSGRFARVLSQSESFHELQVKNRYLSLLNTQDADVVERLNGTRAELLAAQEQLAGQLAAREAAEAELAANEVRLEAASIELVAIIADLESTRAGQLAQQESLLEAQDDIERTLGNLDQQLDDEIVRLQAERQRLLREAQQSYLAERERQRLRDQADALDERIDNLTAPLTAAPSGYVYPVAGHTIVSRYGQDGNSYMAMRASSSNAAVVAVQEGVVRGVSYVSANDGYMVSIAHSDRLSTVYTNLRPPIVRVGDRVTQGQVVGNLGGSTLVAPDTLKLWVQVSENGRSAFIDPASALGF